MMAGLCVMTAAWLCGPAAQAPTPAGQADLGPYFTYQYEPGPRPRSDKVVLKDGTSRVGKVLEWGTQVLVFDEGGTCTAWARDQVERLEIRSATAADAPRPAKPDLTVAFVERLPRDPSWHDKVRYDLEGKKGLGVLQVDPDKYPWEPAEGQRVKFVLHIRNAGGEVAAPFEYRVTIGGAEVLAGRVDTPLAAGQEATGEFEWPWQAAAGELCVELDTGRTVDESSEWNNRFVDPIRARTYFFCVSRNVAEGFSRCRNLVDTYCFEDWAHYHVRTMNHLFARSVYPSAPQGILERVRIDRLIVVEDARDDALRPTWQPQRHRNGDPADVIEYGGTWEFGKVRDDAHAAEWARQVDWGLPHELGHQLGLIDIYQYNTEPKDCLLRDPAGYFVQRHHFFPWPQTMMHWHGPHLFSEVCAGYLNKTRGRPRGFYGDYQYAVPRTCVLEVRAGDGRPAAGVRVDVFQRSSADDLRGFIPDAAIATGTTGADGRFTLPNRPAPHHATPGGYELHDNPFGQIDVVGGNGLLLVRLTLLDREEYHFLRLFDLNVAYLRGQTDQAVIPLRTRFGAPDGPEPPEYTRLYFDQDPAAKKVSFRWPHWGTGGSPPVSEYRVYARTSNGGDETKPWTLVDQVAPQPANRPSVPSRAAASQPAAQPPPPDNRPAQGQPHRSVVPYGKEFSFDGFYSTDTWLAVSAVSSAGREGQLSLAQFIPRVEQALRSAVSPTLVAYIPITGNPDTCMLRAEIRQGFPPHFFRPMGLRCIRPEFRDYRPAATGVAIDPGGRLVVADAFNHQLAWYERGELVQIVGRPERRPDASGSDAGQFNQPSDVAIDSRGRVYVADRGNHRIQVFNDRAEFQFAFGATGDAPAALNDPIALAAGPDRLAVTDLAARRLVIFDITGDRPRYAYTIVGLNDPDRALVGPKGHVYLCDRDAEHRWAIIEFGPGDLKPRRSMRATGQGDVIRPRGLYYDGQRYAFFVNAEPPIKVMWLAVE